MSTQNQSSVPAAYVVTQLQLASLLSIVSVLDRPTLQSANEDSAGGAADGGAKASLEATIIKTCDAIDRIVGETERWDLSKIAQIEDAIVGYYKAQTEVAKANLSPRPCALLRPNLFFSAGIWVAVHGDVVDNRLVGTGSTPKDALEDFDSHFLSRKPNQLFNPDENQ